MMMPNLIPKLLSALFAITVVYIKHPNTTAAAAAADDNVIDANNIFAPSTFSEAPFIVSAATTKTTNVVATTDVWGLDRLNQCNAKPDGFMFKQNAKGVKVFIMSNGIYQEHQEFIGSIGPSDCHKSYIDGEEPLKDGSGWG